MQTIRCIKKTDFAGRSWKIGEVALSNGIPAKDSFKVLENGRDWFKADDLTDLPQFYIDSTISNHPKAKETRRVQAPDGRVWIVPAWEVYSGDLAGVVLQIEDRTSPSIRLKSGCNPMWFVRYYEQYARDRREKFVQVSFEENALKRWPGRVELVTALEPIHPKKTKETLTRAQAKDAIKDAGNNKSLAARNLGVSRTELYRTLKPSQRN